MNFHAVCASILRILGASLIGSIYGWQIGLGVGCLSLALCHDILKLKCDD